MRARRLLAVGLLGILAGCSLPRFGAPDPASRQGANTLSLWQGFFLAALAVAALIYGLVLYALIRFRRRDDTIPRQSHEHIPMEVVYTVIPIIVVAVLFFFTVRTERKVNNLVDRPDLLVRVTGFQWQWQFRYVDADVTVTGTPTGDPPELVLPVGQTVRFELQTADVIHSFWVPDFLYKRDLIPGVDNKIDVDVTKPGTYTGRCAEYCGLDHYRMNFEVRAVDEAEFETWLRDQSRSAETQSQGEGQTDTDTRGS